ncbi:MAG: YhdP family protein, partial [Planctomycetota bacterium]
MRAEKKAKPKPRKSRARRIVKWTGLIVLLLLVLVIVAVPAVVSSGGFRNFLLSKINESVGGRADFSDLSMGWLKGVRVKDLSFNDDAGQVSVKVKQVATKPHYASLLGGNLSFGRTTIEKPEIEINLKEKPVRPETPTAPTEPVPAETAAIALVTDISITDGRVKVTDAQSRTAELSKINSNIGLRLPGKESTFDLDTVLVAKGKESKIHADAKLTPRKPKKGKGWTLAGAAGELTVEIDELDLESLEPFIALSGADISTKGVVSADIRGQVKDGKLAEVIGKVRGSDLDITVADLKGDRIRTKTLDADVKLTQKDDMISIDALTLKTDWAGLNATGAVPTNLDSLDSLLAPDSTAELKGSFNCDLAAVASQIPNTLGLKEGTNITSGRIVGEVQTVARAGKKQIRGSADISDLKGIVDGKAAALSEPVKAAVLISKDKTGMTFDDLNVSASFAKIECTGTTEKIDYSGAVDLAKFQSELGQFVDMGGYRMSGTITEAGEVAISEERIVATGSGEIRSLKITSPNDVTVTEPKAEVRFAVDVDKKQEIIAVKSVKADAGFGQVNVADAVIPFGEKPARPMDLTVRAANIDLAKLRPFAVMFGSFPEDMHMSGMAESEVVITSKEQTYNIRTDKSLIKNFSLSTPGKKPFAQPEISLVADVEISPTANTVKKFDLQSDQIKVSVAPARLTTEDGTSTLVGKADLEYDWDAVGRAASGYLPTGFAAKGKRKTSIEFASKYPADDSGKLLANLNLSTNKCTFGFDGIDYRGLSMGVTDVNAQFEKGLLKIDPFTTAANGGVINLGANADFKGAG